MMSDPVPVAVQLVECLQRQAELFRRFLDLLARQHGMLLSGDAGGLEEVAREQDDTMARARECEVRRRELTVMLADAPEPASGSFGLEPIRELVAASDASRLDRLVYTLATLQREIDRRQRLNQLLICQSLRYTEDRRKQNCSPQAMNRMRHR